MKFTKAAINSFHAPAGKADHVVWDDDLPGFGLRVRGGRQTWIIQYRVNGGQQRRESFDPRQISLDTVRAIAKQRFAMAHLGQDPGADRAKAKAEAEAAKATLKVVAAQYLEARSPVLRPATVRAARWHLDVLWAPLHGRPIAGIRRADVTARLGEIVRDSGRVSAAQARRTLSALFAWSISEGIPAVESNPVTGSTDPGAGRQARDRVLTDAEMRAVWHAADPDVLNDFGAICRLLIPTGCRRQEIGGLSWSEVDLTTALVTIPGSRTKNRERFEITLPEPALDILRAIPRQAGNPHVFGTARCGFSAWSSRFSALCLRIAEAQGRPLAAWRLHDIRRSVRTGLAALRIPPHIAERVIGHSRSSAVEAVYDHHSYREEVADALRVWAEHVRSVVEG